MNQRSSARPRLTAPARAGAQRLEQRRRWPRSGRWAGRARGRRRWSSRPARRRAPGTPVVHAVGEQAVDDLVDRAVAAEGDHDVGAVAHRPAGERGGVPAVGGLARPRARRRCPARGPARRARARWSRSRADSTTTRTRTRLRSNYRAGTGRRRCSHAPSRRRSAGRCGRRRRRSAATAAAAAAGGSRGDRRPSRPARWLAAVVLLVVKTRHRPPAQRLAGALLGAALRAARRRRAGAVRARAAAAASGGPDARSWCSQLLALPVGYSLAFQAGRSATAAPILVAALAVLYLLFTPPARGRARPRAPSAELRRSLLGCRLAGLERSSRSA